MQILSFVAENERINIRQRQQEGIASAKLRGVKFGRPVTSYSDDFISVCQSYFDRKITLDEALIRLRIKRCNFYYHAHRLQMMGYLPLCK